MSTLRLLLAGTVVGAALFAGNPTVLAGPAGPAVAIDPKIVTVVERKLDNGLRVLFLEDHSVPSVTFWTFYRVGSRNERPGITGLSHLFEHMMFNGAKKYGPKQFDQQLERAGGSSNAFTSQDMTAYYEDFPPEALELVVDLESDRLRSLTITDKTLEPERGVVKEERRLRTDDDPMGALEEKLYEKAFDKHPYRWPVVGWMKDLNAIKTKDAVDYFGTYYGPNNATIVLVGDFNTDAAFDLIKKSFSDIPKRPDPPKLAASVTEPAQKAAKRVELKREAQLGALMIGYKAPAAAEAPGKMHPDVPRLDVIQKLLAGGESSLLYRTLVYEKQLCVDVGVYFQWTLDPNLFIVTARLAPGVKSAEVEKEIDAVLKSLADKGPTEDELAKAKTQLVVDQLSQLSTNNGRGLVVGSYDYFFGSYQGLLEAPKVYEAVTAKDVQDAAKKYLIPAGRTTAVLIPTEGAK